MLARSTRSAGKSSGRPVQNEPPSRAAETAGCTRGRPTGGHAHRDNNHSWRGAPVVCSQVRFASGFGSATNSGTCIIGFCCVSNKEILMNENYEAASRRAYAIWEQAGRPDGQDQKHWQQALRDLGLTPSLEATVASRGTYGLEDLPSNAASMRLAIVRPERK
jgi:hypothetical protein